MVTLVQCVEDIVGEGRDDRHGDPLGGHFESLSQRSGGPELRWGSGVSTEKGGRRRKIWLPIRRADEGVGELTKVRNLRYSKMSVLFAEMGCWEEDGVQRGRGLSSLSETSSLKHSRQMGIRDWMFRTETRAGDRHRGHQQRHDH